jgi:kynureninase
VPWVNIDAQAASVIAPIVGAESSEVAVMQTLTANLHLLMSSFFRPTEQRFKIVIEGKAFPSDHYAVHSQLHHHNLDPAKALVLIEPDVPETRYMSTQHILGTIKQHADEIALILLPGIHFYSGQLLDISTITAFAHEAGIPAIGWDLAHAVGNVPLQLHDWNVDFAAWCSYKYLNGGPGAIGGLFVHERHGRTSAAQGWAAGTRSLTIDEKLGYKPRLSGWWGSSKESRFAMENVFVPIEGASGWQLSNPSMLDTTSVIASLSVFEEAGGMQKLREKSLRLTEYLEYLLKNWSIESMGLEKDAKRPYALLTPSDPAQRGAQISVRLDEGLLEGVMEVLEREGVVVDERKPDVVRVAPAPLYNNFSDVWHFMDVFSRAISETRAKTGGGAEHAGGTMVRIPEGEKGWGEIT